MKVVRPEGPYSVWRPRLRINRLCIEWKINAENRSGSGFAANLDDAAMLFDNLTCNPQSKSRAQIFLGGEERIENRVHVLALYAATCVRDGHPQCIVSYV